MSNLIYNSFKEFMADNTIDMDNDTFKCCLLLAAYTPDAEAHSVYTNLTNEVANGNGYTTGGVALSSVVWDRTTGTVKFDAADSSWTDATFTARYAAIYSETSTKLVLLIDFGADKSVTAGTFTIQWHADGIFTLS